LTLAREEEGQHPRRNAVFLNMTAYQERGETLSSLRKKPQLKAGQLLKGGGYFFSKLFFRWGRTDFKGNDAVSSKGKTNLPDIEE